jgi:hypothetical protein
MITAVESAQLRTNLRLGITRRGSRSLGAVTSISHVVLVSWKTGKEIQAEELVRPAIRGFVGTIPGVLAVVEGHSSSPEGLEDGYDYGFVVTFATAQARDAYLNDPSHRPVADAIGAAAQRIVVFDI